VEKRFGALRVIAGIFRILGWLVLLIGLIFGGLSVANALTSGGQMFGGMMGFGVMSGLLTVLYSILAALLLIGFGEVVYLLIALEANTRATALLLRRSTEVVGPVAPVAGEEEAL
jgi:uncharacterized membrane protein